MKKISCRVCEILENRGCDVLFMQDINILNSNAGLVLLPGRQPKEREGKQLFAAPSLPLLQLVYLEQQMVVLPILGRANEQHTASS